VKAEEASSNDSPKETAMTIFLSDAGKRFNRDWIFRHFNYSFHTGSSYAVIGPNGSGKSTLLQTIGGAIALSEGKLTVGSWQSAAGSQQPTGVSRELLTSNQQPETGNQKSVTSNERPATGNQHSDNLYQYISIAAPYLDVIEEMTVIEFLQFHQTFKPFLAGHSIKEIIARVSLDNAANKQIRYYSSGMKQRVKLAQAIFSDTPIVLLDEPCTNLDGNGIEIYHQLINDYCNERLVIVSSNDETEYGFCKEKVNITDYK
jgi:ABC-2 type transport system ATP-binding protein